MTEGIVRIIDPRGVGVLFDPAMAQAFGQNANLVATLFVFCLGACLGSFANACAMRLVREEDFVKTASRCRGCETRLSWRENLPIFGYLLLRGRCRHCQMRLSPRYLIVEAVAGLMLVAYAASLPLALTAGFGIALVFIGIACLTDLEALTLHPALLSAFGVIGLSLSILGDFGLITWHLSSAQSLAGAVASAAIPMAVNAIYRMVRGRNGFGEGDFWLLAAIGAWLGPVMGPALFLASCWLGAIIGVGMMMTGRGSVMTKLPFGLFAGCAFILWPNLFTRVF